MINHRFLTRPSTLERDPLRDRSTMIDERRPNQPAALEPLFDDYGKEGCERILRHRTAGEVRVVRLHLWDRER
jgi:hypothetical protein